MSSKAKSKVMTRKQKKNMYHTETMKKSDEEAMKKSGEEAKRKCDEEAMKKSDEEAMKKIECIHQRLLADKNVLESLSEKLLSVEINIMKAQELRHTILDSKRWNSGVWCAGWTYTPVLGSTPGLSFFHPIIMQTCARLYACLWL